MVVFVSLLLTIVGAAIAIYADDQIQRMKEEEKLDNYHRTSYFVFTQKKYEDLISNKGDYGEYSVYSKLKAYEQFGGKFLFNLYLPKEDDSTSEIDLLFLTPKGLFVIESKNYEGFISGGEEDFYWTQKLGTQVNIKFYNPVMQNANHVATLKKYVPDNLPIYSIVVFSDKCRLSCGRITQNDTYVINKAYLPMLVKELLDNSEMIISFREVNGLQEALFPYSQVSDEVKQNHIENINRMLKEHDEAIAEDDSNNNEVKPVTLKELLEQFRKYKSYKLNVAESNIFDNDELDKLIMYKPASFEQLKMNGILSVQQLYSHGMEIADMINDFMYTERLAKR